MENISFMKDVRKIWETIGKVLKRENIRTKGTDTSEDYGDYLLRIEKRSILLRKQQEAVELLNHQKVGA